MKKTTIIIIVGILLISIIGYKITGGIINKGPGKYDDFAQCLTDNEIIMYGTDWCPHCKDQKKLFGNSFEFVHYIDCDWNKELCLNEGIRGYPTWKINGESYPGTQSLERLSQLSGCEL